MRILRILTCMGLATVIWLASLHLLFARDAAAVAAPLAARQLALWSDDSATEVAIASLRRGNPEWDLMARMFTVIGFGNLALDRPAERAGYLAAIDRIIARTVHDVDLDGPTGFLLPYGRARPFVDPAGRSIFVDGELAMMLAVRQVVAPVPAGAAVLRAQVELIAGELERAPALLAESYPDEAWLFCHAVALAAIALADRVDGAPDRHRALIARWIANAKQRLVDPRTGLLVSRLTRAGEVMEGPEGSTLWLSATMLRLVDDDFAHAQFAAARAELRGSLAGFGWAREWPASWPGRDDVDSGPTIPIVGANAGSSGLALIAARGFGDREFEAELVTSLEFAGFPVDGGAHFAAGNPLADAVVLCALTGGPVWARGGAS